MEEFPPGFRFYPTEEELVSFYLRNKLEGSERQDFNGVIPVVDVYELEPWHLPEVSGVLCHGDNEQWFYFVPRQEREARGGRPNRTTTSGYWKATGSPSYVYSSDSRVIGVKRTMVFYQGKAPTGEKTKWKMHEYRAIEFPDTQENLSSFAVPKLRHEWSLCRVYVVSGSFSVFDRRPLRQEREIVLTSNQANLRNDHMVASSSQNTIETENHNSTSTTRVLSTSVYPHHGQDTGANVTTDNIGNGNYWEIMASGTGNIHFDEGSSEEDVKNQH